MRLSCVEKGHRVPQKLMLAFMRAVMGQPVPDVVRTVLYRPAFFGKPFGAWTQAVMRGPSTWSVGERELFAAFVSGKNQCPF